MQPVTVSKKESVSGRGIVGAFLFLIGIPCLALGVVPSVIVMIFGLAIGATANRNTTYLVCPKCKNHEEI